MPGLSSLHILSPAKARGNLLNELTWIDEQLPAGEKNIVAGLAARAVKE
jgi:hypothetical protein